MLKKKGAKLAGVLRMNDEKRCVMEEAERRERKAAFKEMPFWGEKGNG